ncbi:MAG: hypothetical protein WBY94_05390, partial [Polyangiaceae bacterium]
MAPAEDFERLPLVRMPRSQDGYAFRITIEVVVGIMACLPSTRFLTRNCSNAWLAASAMARC